MRWRVGWGLRVFMWACFSVLLSIGTVLASRGDRTSDRIIGWVMLGAVPVMVWLLTLRPYVERTSDALMIQNPVRFHRVALAEVRDTALLNTGLGIRLSDGREIVAWALQQGLLLTLLGWNSRAVRAERDIRSAAQALRNHGGRT